MKQICKTKILLKIIIFWVVTLCFSVDIHPYFGGMYCRYLQDHEVTQARNQPKAGSMQSEPTARP
jgi:hypothetical protein